MNARPVGCALLVLSLITLSCARRPAPAPPAEPTAAESPAPADIAQRIEEMRSHLSAFVDTHARLPARNDERNRQLISRSFEQLHDMIVELIGEQSDGTDRQRLQMILRTSEQVQSGDRKLSMEPTVNSGLRAVRNALSRVTQQRFRNDKELAVLLERLDERLYELDGLRGPLHRLVVAQAFAASGRAVEHMINRLEEQLILRSTTTPTTTTAPATTQSGT